MVRFGARDYYPQICCWTNKDPIGFRSGSLNLYKYVHYDPVNWIDINGLGRYVIIVGQQGIAEHNVGPNFSRVANTRAQELRNQNHTVDIISATYITDFNDAITSGPIIDGGVIYYGHGGNIGLFVGQSSDPGTNILCLRMTSISDNRNCTQHRSQDDQHNPENQY